MKRIYSLVLFLICLSINAQEPLAEFYKNFKSGLYQKAIDSLEQIELKDNSLSSKYYLSAIAYSKLQEFDKAASFFEKALNENNDSQDLYYEYGQALYAMNELKKSRDAFALSAKKNFNKGASLYYVAHISQILEDFGNARNNYLELLKVSDLDFKLKQVGKFQLAETNLNILRQKEISNEELTKAVEKVILPMLKEALQIDLKSPASSDIKNRISELEKEFDLDPNLLRNGRRISPKRYTAHILQRIKFDDNISLTNEENNVSGSFRESYIFDSEVFYEYDFVLKKRFLISPSFRGTFTQHSDQDNAEVFQNDSSILNFSLKNKYEHLAFMQPASFLFNIDFSKTLKDKDQTHTRKFYADALTFTFGEQFTYFSFGDTNFKFKFKDYSAYTTSLNNYTTSFSIDQTVATNQMHLLIFMLDYSSTDNYNNTSSNTNTLLFRTDYIIPEIAPKYTLAFALSLNLTDTLEQKSTRGTEWSINPSVDFSKDVTKNLKFNINFDYTNAHSKSTSYTYNKSVITTELKYSF